MSGIFVAFRRGTMPVRHICRRVSTCDAIHPTCLSSRFNAACRMSGIFLVVFRHDIPSVRHTYYCVATQHVAFFAHLGLVAVAACFVVAYSSSMAEPASGGIQHARRNRELPPILGAAAYILGLPPTSPRYRQRPGGCGLHPRGCLRWPKAAVFRLTLRFDINVSKYKQLSSL